MAAKKNGYDPAFKERLYELREEEGLGLREALDTAFEENPTWKRKYRKRLVGKDGTQRASAILTNLRKSKEREEENQVVWCLHMTNSTGTVVSNERLPEESAQRVMAALDLPRGLN